MKIILKTGCFLALTSLIFLAIAFAQAAEDLSGTWTARVDMRDAGIDELTLTLKKDGALYSGIINDTLDYIAKDAALTDLKVEGSSISFSFPAMGGEQEWGMTLKLDGDKMNGQLIYKAKGGGPEVEFFRKR